jgi:hypothetical protein
MRREERKGQRRGIRMNKGEERGRGKKDRRGIKGEEKRKREG